MPWTTEGRSARAQRLPRDWGKRRLRVLRRDHYACQVRDDPSAPKCGRPGREVDHVEPGDNHDPSNLQTICPEHHKGKTQAEAYQARTMRRPPERHPGLL